MSLKKDFHSFKMENLQEKKNLHYSLLENFLTS